MKRILSEKVVDEMLIEYHQTDDINIRNKVVINYIYIVKLLAKKISEQTGISVEDLEESGYEGLIKAIEKYDVTMPGSRFNYIVQVVRRTMFDSFSEIIGFGYKKIANAYLLEKSIVEKEYDKTLMEDLELVDVVLDHLIARKVISKENRQDNKRRILLNIADSLNNYKNEQDLIAEDLEEKIINQELQQQLLTCLKSFPEDSQELIRLRFGFFEDPLTLAETGERLYMSIEGVRKKEIRILNQLCQLMEEEYLITRKEDINAKNYQKQARVKKN